MRQLECAANSDCSWQHEAKRINVSSVESGQKKRVLQLCEIYRLQLDYVPCLGPTLLTVKLREFDNNQVKTESIAKNTLNRLRLLRAQNENKFYNFHHSRMKVAIVI